MSSLTNKESHFQSFLAYPKAMRQLKARIGATPEELAAWIFLGPKDGGIAAYMNANELDTPPLFFYASSGDSYDYIAPLMACWFKVNDIDQFEPADRFITGSALIERWGQRLGLHDAGADSLLRAQRGSRQVLAAGRQSPTVCQQIPSGHAHRSGVASGVGEGQGFVGNKWAHE